VPQIAAGRLPHARVHALLMNQITRGSDGMGLARRCREPMRRGRQIGWAVAAGVTFACTLALATPGLAGAASVRGQTVRTDYWRGSSRTVLVRTELRATRATRDAGGIRQPGSAAADHHAPPAASRPVTSWCSRTIEGRGQTREHRRRAPDSWSARDLPCGRRSPTARGPAGRVTLAQLTAGEAVFHDAHAPPTRP